MDILFDINSFNVILPTIIATVIATIIINAATVFVKLCKESFTQKPSKHYIISEQISNIFYSLYIIIVPFGCIIIFLGIFTLLLLAVAFFFPVQYNNVILFFNDQVFIRTFIIIISIFIEVMVYKSNIFKKVKAKPHFRAVYIFFPTFILVLSLLPASIFSYVLIVILFIINLPVLFTFQPRTDYIIYNKMDINLNNGMCYLNLDTKNVNFKKNTCIIDVFYNSNTHIKKETILIPVTNIVAKRYYDADYKIDFAYNFLLKHFPCIFVDQHKENQDDI